MSSLYVVDHLLLLVVHALKSLEVLTLTLPNVSPNTIKVLRALPRSQLREFGFTLTEDRQEVCYSLTCLLHKGQQSLLSYLSLVHYYIYRMECSAILDNSKNESITLCPLSLIGQFNRSTVSGDGKGNQWLFYTDKAVRWS